MPRLREVLTEHGHSRSARTCAAATSSSTAPSARRSSACRRGATRSRPSSASTSRSSSARARRSRPSSPGTRSRPRRPIRRATWSPSCPEPAADGRSRPPRGRPRRYLVRGRELYLWLPDGITDTPLASWKWDQLLGVPGTARNWNTVTKLAELALRPPFPRTGEPRRITFGSPHYGPYADCSARRVPGRPRRRGDTVTGQAAGAGVAVRRPLPRRPRRLAWELSDVVRAAPGARRAAPSPGRASAGDDAATDARRAVVLAFDEMASNALRHGGGGVPRPSCADAGRLAGRGPRLRRARPPQPAVGRDPSQGGLGLYLIAEMADRPRLVPARRPEARLGAAPPPLSAVSGHGGTTGPPRPGAAGPPGAAGRRPGRRRPPSPCGRSRAITWSHSSSSGRSASSASSAASRADARRPAAGRGPRPARRCRAARVAPRRSDHRCSVRRAGGSTPSISSARLGRPAPRSGRRGAARSGGGCPAFDQRSRVTPRARSPRSCSSRATAAVAIVSHAQALDRPVQVGEHGGRAPAAAVGDAAQQPAQLAHRRGGLGVVPHDVADDQHRRAAGLQEGVVPVAADLGGLPRPGR